jgi:hypothetical protein
MKVVVYLGLSAPDLLRESLVAISSPNKPEHPIAFLPQNLVRLEFAI